MAIELTESYGSLRAPLARLPTLTEASKSAERVPLDDFEVLAATPASLTCESICSSPITMESSPDDTRKRWAIASTSRRTYTESRPIPGVLETQSRNARSASSAESEAMRISILLHVTSCAYSLTPGSLGSFSESRERRRASASLKERDEVLKDVPTRTTEEPLVEADGLAFACAAIWPSPCTGRETLSGCSTRVDFKKRATTPYFII